MRRCRTVLAEELLEGMELVRADLVGEGVEAGPGQVAWSIQVLAEGPPVLITIAGSAYRRL